MKLIYALLIEISILRDELNEKFEIIFFSIALEILFLCDRLQNRNRKNFQALIVFIYKLVLKK
jgi:hypothetical protein